MYFMISESDDIYYNLALEETLLEAGADDDILIFWHGRPSVVLGAYQNIYAETRLGFLEENGIKPARRMTGGGCVYHDMGCINYSIIKKCSREEVSYGATISFIRDLLDKAGIETADSTGSEIVLKSSGGKISGSAQKYSKGVLLHHGTLLFSTDIPMLERACTPPDSHLVHRGIRSNPGKVSDIRDWYPDKFRNEDDFILSLVSGIPERREFSPVSLKGHINELAERKYMSFEWIYGKSPDCIIRKNINSDGKTADINIKIRSGKIEEITFDDKGPFTEELCKKLAGSFFSYKDILKATEDRNLTNILFS